MNKYFESDNLTFIASAQITSRSITVVKVILHPDPIKAARGMKMYSLTPFDVCKKLFQEYQSDRLSVSPLQLNFRIANLRCMTVQEEIK